MLSDEQGLHYFPPCQLLFKYSNLGCIPVNLVFIGLCMYSSTILCIPCFECIFMFFKPLVTILSLQHTCSYSLHRSPLSSSPPTSWFLHSSRMDCLRVCSDLEIDHLDVQGKADGLNLFTHSFDIGEK